MQYARQSDDLAESAKALLYSNLIMIDDTDRLLLAALAADARAPLKDLAEAIRLSPPATSERLAR
jgi:DNA-binding Lrp family transcriptional regulator